jgi:hypothetical protein
MCLVPRDTWENIVHPVAHEPFFFEWVSKISTIWLFNSLPWKDPPIFKFGKPSISMGHGFNSKQQITGEYMN